MAEFTGATYSSGEQAARIVKLFQRKVVRYRNQPGYERADFQQYDPEGQAITTRWGGHEPTLPIPDPRSLNGLRVAPNNHLLFKSVLEATSFVYLCKV
jgi:hypothetical protein